jgi:adenylate kinase
MLDGFPRNVAQAQQLGQYLNSVDLALDRVINIEVDKDILVGRAVGRRICKSCGATYHVEFNPPKVDGTCDVCGGELYQRADDNEETVSKRIQVYLDETKPLADYYSNEGIIANINGEQSIDKVFADIVDALGSEK